MPGYLLTVGETMGLVHSENIGALAVSDRLRFAFGGAESNVAIAAARLGADTHWIGRVGDDESGDVIRRELHAEQVALHAVVDPDAPTGFMVKTRPSADSTSVRYYRKGSAGSRLNPDDVPDGIVENAAILHVTGITPALSQSAADTVRSVVDRAGAAGVPVSFDINHRSRLWSAEQAAATYRELARSATIVFAGDDEARIIVDGESPRELAIGMQMLGPSSVIIKLGAEGSHALIDGEEHVTRALRVPVVDTVGAGDAFVGAYLAELIADRPTAIRLATANAAGAFACQVPGDWEGMPRRRDLARIQTMEPVDR
jgi:2-dehydro-3-deoxygluconokinase